jgi:ATP-binding cassette, subfamily B, bacterial
MYKKFPFYKQNDSKDCGPTCLKIIAKHYGKTISTQELRSLSETTRAGSSLLRLSNAAEKIGFHTLGAKLPISSLHEIPLPCILHWDEKHYLILYKIKKGKFYISDPAFGLITHSEKEFLTKWGKTTSKDNEKEGIVLMLEPTPGFFKKKFEEKKKVGFSFLFKYTYLYKSFIFQLFLGLIAGSLLQLIFPFLTQSIVDVGIQNQNIHFIYLVLMAQLSIFIGRTAIDTIRGWTLLHLSTRVNISLISDFFIKLMNLPISYFDTRMTGDIMQRIGDHSRIERILTTSSLNVLFSVINLLIFGLVLLYYNFQIFGIFFIGSVLYFSWIIAFLKKRREIDHLRFSQSSEEQSKVIELISGMQEIKLNNAETKKRWGWEYLQVKLFKISIKSLAIQQYQFVGGRFINELKNILITVLSAKLVIEGNLTLGMMLAITYIVGQLNSPIVEIINFILEYQDAKISLERLSEIHNKEDEEPIGDEKISDISNNSDFNLNKVSFRYIGSDQFVLEELDLHVPNSKITAIVGVSGSGKTTLMKLLLKFYEPTFGDIKLGNTSLKNISQKTWRNQSGVVMQEGYIFSDTIANNIAVGEDFIDKNKLAHAVDVANIKEFIESLPLSYNTKIGMEGVGLSTGQKQRLLIARAVYKNPNYLFFDEATSALDANNEKVIMEKLNTFFENKTVLVIAHRLSTVKNAHQIVVLNKGKIVEVGNHESLIKKKGSYYNLVKNQLDLGK